jgi:hypothetical protein
MTVFLILTAIAYGIFQTGCIIQLVVKGYQGWTLFWKNYDRLPIFTVLAISETLHFQTHLEAYLQPLIMLSSGIPSPASQHRQHQVVYTILVWPDFHLRMVRSSTASRLASWLSVREISPLTSWISSTVGFCQVSADQRIAIKFFGLDKIAEIPFGIRIHNSSS